MTTSEATTTTTGTSSAGSDALASTSSTSEEPEPVAECGNGVVDPGEECDDANEEDVDACLSTCVAPRCGDGIVWTGEEECDDGNLDASDACSPTCSVAVCGDGHVRDGEEECDDANEVDNDSCTNSCAHARCGDGIVQQGVEQCDEAGETATCDSDCTEPACGDGHTNKLAGEECDDGNDSPADNCYPSCTAPSMLIFVSSKIYDGNLGGVEGADSKCQTLAKQAGLGGTYKAWLWTSKTGPEETFYQSPGRYIRPDLVEIAGNFDQLLHGPLSTLLNVTEKKEMIGPDDGFWTGVYPFGQWPGPKYWSPAHTCLDWTSNVPSFYGNASYPSWQSLGLDGDTPWDNCETWKFRLVCVQQAWNP